MNLIERLARKLAARKLDNKGRYWAAITKAAEGNLGDRAADQLIEDLEPLLVDLGKSEVGDVSADIEAMRAFNAAKLVADAAEDDRASAGDLRAAAVDLEQRVVELHDESERVGKQAEENRNRANSLCAAADGASRELGRARARLVAAGHPQLSAGAAADAKPAEIASLLGELTSLEVGTAYGRHPGGADARRSEIVSKLRRLGHVVPKERLQKQLPGGRKSEVQELLDELSNLERGIYGVEHGSNVRRDPDARRDAIAARLRELGHVVDEERLSRSLPNSRRRPAAESPR